MNKTGPRRWHEQRWLIDDAIASHGIEFDQNRLRYSLGPARDETSAADIGILRASITTLADLTPVASVHAQRHETLARRLAVKFVSDDPSATLVQHLADVYLANATAIGHWPPSSPLTCIESGGSSNCAFLEFSQPTAILLAPFVARPLTAHDDGLRHLPEVPDRR